MADPDYGAYEDFKARYKSGGNGDGNGGPRPRIAVEWWNDVPFSPISQTFVKHLLGYGACSLWYGEIGSGKTFLVFYLSFCVALGWPFFGRKVKRGIVVYIAAEGGSSIRHRLEAFRRHYDLSAAGEIPLGLITAPINLLDPAADLEALIDAVKAAAAEHRGLELRMVVIDTLNRALAGGNENAPDDMGAFIHNIDRLRQETGSHVAIVHHPGKDASRGARGHSSLRAAVDTEVEMVKAETQEFTTATVTKQRDEETGAVFAFRLQAVDLGFDEDGDAVTSCAVKELETPAETPKPRTKAKTLPPEVLRAVEFLREVLAMPSNSQRIDRPDYPQVMATTVEAWRSYLQERGLYEPTSTGRTRFQRMKEKLIGARLIVIDGNLVWPVPRA
jgi:AAA domain